MEVVNTTKMANNLIIRHFCCAQYQVQTFIIDMISHQNVIPDSYARKAEDAINSKNKLLQNLLYHKKIPVHGWSKKAIEDLFLELSISQQESFFNDRSKFSSDIVSRRNYNYLHGANPLAFRSSSKYGEKEDMLKIIQLANSFLSELIKMMGVTKHFDCGIFPVATGMSLVFVMLTFSFLKPDTKYVIWSRIDQKSCFKSILSAGFIPIIIDMKEVNGEYVSDIEKIEVEVIRIGAEKINCILSTTSCFAPRACDNIEHISAICSKYNIYHLINNAYGLSNRYIMKRINKTNVNGRIDVFVQSTDKNLCVPVGGAIIVSFNKQIFSKLSEICSEKMSISPTIDVVLTLLEMGKRRYIEMIDNCEAMYTYLKSEISKLAERYNEKVIDNPGNPISIALTLSNISKKALTKIGSMLYTRNVSGARVITTEEVKSICGHQFERWGAHSRECRVPYLTAAASIGILKSDIDMFIDKLDKVLFSLENK